LLIRKKRNLCEAPILTRGEGSSQFFIYFFAYHSHWLILSCDKLNKSTSTLRIIILCLLPAKDNIINSHNWTDHFFHAHRSSFPFIISRHLPWLRSVLLVFFLIMDIQINLCMLHLIIHNLKLTTSDQDSNQRTKGLAFLHCHSTPRTPLHVVNRNLKFVWARL
jgi:hypothetical protein